LLDVPEVVAAIAYDFAVSWFVCLLVVNYNLMALFFKDEAATPCAHAC
jgi:hypothetical protein